MSKCSTYAGIQTEVLKLDSATDPVIAINSSTIDPLSPRITVALPLDLLHKFDQGNGSIRIVSAIYTNASRLLRENG